MPDAIFDVAIATVLQHEGGYVCDPHDAGGETNFGICKRSYPGIDIKGLTREKAKAIYYTDFWLKYRINRLPGVLLPSKVLDTAVNIGPTRAIRLLQRCIAAQGVPCLVDDVIGPTTIAACSKVDLSKVLDAYRAALKQHYVDIVAEHPSQGRFLSGWLARAAS
jgi:lysozyme family protein